MKAFILAAGDSTRLRPLTEHVPKPMLPIAGKPILEHNIRLLALHGVREIIINLHHCPDVVRSHFGDGSRFGVSIDYSPEPVLRGTAGALTPFADRFRAPFFLIYGDNLSTCDLTRLAAQHQRTGGAATIAVFQRPDVANSGVVEFDAADRVQRFVEKPNPAEVSSNWVNAGVVMLDPAVVGLIPAERPSDFGRDIFPLLLERGDAMHAYRMVNEGLWWVDSPADYERTLKQLDASALA